MNIHKLALIIIICTITIKYCLSSNQYELTDEQISSKWKQISQLLNKKKIIQVKIGELSLESYQKIFGLQLKNIQEIHFNPPQNQDLAPIYSISSNFVPSHKLIETIFTSTYFNQLKLLSLVKTSIDDRYFQFLKNNSIVTSLNHLDLSRDFIGTKGFQYLSNIQFTNLTSLILRQTQLRSEKAVNSLIKIICGDLEDKCRNNIKQLDLSHTDISREGLIKLLKRINHNSLIQLTLDGLNLIYQHKYQDGFNYSAFQILPIFKNLQKLSLNNTLLDDQVAEIFKSWRLPNLTFLNIWFIKWITRQNMPYLNRLWLNKNGISDKSIIHLGNQNFKLIEFYLQECYKLTSEGGRNLININLQNLQKLKLGMDISVNILNNIIAGKRLLKLKYLTLSKNNLIKAVFSGVNWNKLINLQYLRISNIKISDQQIIRMIGKYQVIHSNLKSLLIQNDYISGDSLLILLALIPECFPNLQYLGIIANTQNKLTFQVLTGIEFKSNFILNLNGNQFRLNNGYIDIISLWNVQILFSNLFKQHDNKIIQHNDEDMDMDIIQTNFKKRIKLMNFNNIKCLKFTNIQILQLFVYLFRKQQIKQFNNLIQLSSQGIIYDDIIRYQLIGFQFPKLNQLSMQIVVLGDIELKQIQENIIPFFQQFKRLSFLKLKINFLNQKNGFNQRKLFFDSLYYPQLYYIELINQKLQTQQIYNFIEKHNQTIRYLDLGINFLQKNILKLLGDLQIPLVGLNLNSTSFTIEQFIYFGKLNTQFLLIVHLAQVGLADEHIIRMIKQKNDRPFLPRLSFLDISQNQIRKDGLQSLLSLELFHLIVLDLSGNDIPEYINLILTYPTRIIFILADNINIYSFSKNLSSISSRNIEGFTIKTSFTRQDFQNLNKLIFTKLKYVSFQLNNIYDCQSLNYIVRIIQYAEVIQIKINNDKYLLNSTCFNQDDIIMHASYIIVHDHYGTTYLPQFIDKLTDTKSQLIMLSLVNTRLSPHTIQQILSKQNTKQLQILQLKYNYVNKSLLPILDVMHNINLLDLTNADLNDEVIQMLSQSNLDNLLILTLNQNNLGSLSIKSIRSFQKLFVLNLNNCGLDGQSLQQFSSLQLPYLYQIDLSYNNFEVSDILIFVTNINRKSFPILKSIQMRGISISIQNYSSIIEILKLKDIQIILDKPYNKIKINSAYY